VNGRAVESNCVFCKIVGHEIPSERLYEDDELLAFRDIHPKAPLHALVIPRTHIATVNDLDDIHAELAGRMFLVAKRLAADHGYSGFRCVVNTNKDGGQVVFHIHMHVLAGRPMQATLG
jgi:histidine triad (HIT) family protein